LKNYIVYDVTRLSPIISQISTVGERKKEKEIERERERERERKRERERYTLEKFYERGVWYE